MIHRALDADGDWLFGAGKQSFALAQAALTLNIRTRLQSWLNDAFWATDFGIDWWNLLSLRSAAAQAGIILACRQMISGSWGVVRINSVEAYVDGTTRHLVVSYNVDTIYSRGVLSSVTIA